MRGSEGERQNDESGDCKCLLDDRRATVDAVRKTEDIMMMCVLVLR